MSSTALTRPAAELSALERILEWSQDRPLWQRDALRRIVAKGPLDAVDVDELVALCKQGHGNKDTALTPVPLAKAHLAANPRQAEAVSLLAIADVRGVNQLAPDQRLPFAPRGITIVYGDNGAGKSGYARILKRACRARHAGKIEPNVYELAQSPASATLTYAIGGVAQAPEAWKDAEAPHPTLSAVSVFDAECATVHLSEKNEVAFRPFGLDIPDELAHAFQQVKSELEAEQKRLQGARNPLFAKPPWRAGGAVAAAMAQLRHDTDLHQLARLGTLTEEESRRLARLREDLAKDSTRAAAEQRLKAENVKRLAEAVADLATNTAEARLLSVHQAARAARVARAAATAAAARAFGEEALAGVGGDVWRVLWDAARRYSMEVAYPGRPFPPTSPDALCLLCQQPLTDAQARMSRFEAFVQADTERQAKTAETAAADAERGLAGLVISARTLGVSLREVALGHPELAQRARRDLALARLRRRQLQVGLAGDEPPPFRPAVATTVAELRALETILRSYATELQQAGGSEERKRLEAERDALHDREQLGAMMATVRDEVARLAQLQFLDRCLADTVTNKITALGNDIADSVVTPKLRDRFLEEILRLAAEKVRVEIVRSGGKYGSPQYQVRLLAKPQARVKDILSEGERTCVALAAFLTEVVTAPHQSAFVFDDPVSSLDHRWRDKVANRLVEEAQQRQVIVFTHDLVFVHDLNDRARELGCPTSLLSVTRAPNGAGVVSQGLPWQAQRVEDRIDKMEKAARAARDLYEQNDDGGYRKAAADVYAPLRASWERAIEEVAFAHVLMRHRDYIDTKHLKKVAVLTAEDCDAFGFGYNKCCDAITAHDPAGGRNAEAPPPKEVLADIQALAAWVRRLRDKQKKVV